MGDLERQLGQPNPSAAGSAVGAGADAGRVIGTGAAVNAGADAGMAVGNAPGSYGTSSLAIGLMGPGAGFKFDQDTLHKLVRGWQDLAQKFEACLVQARVITQVRPPGREYASGGHAEKVQASGQALVTTLTARKQYCLNMADKFVQALGKYATAEETHAAAIKQTGDSL